MHESTNTRLPAAADPPIHDDDLVVSLAALSVLMRTLDQALSQLLLASNLYAAGARRLTSLASGARSSRLRLEAVAKALDLHTPEASLVSFLNDSDPKPAA